MGREPVDYISIPNIKHIYGFTSAWIRRLGRPRKLGHSNAYGFPRAKVESYIETHQAEYLCMLLGRAKQSKEVNDAHNQAAQELIAWARTVEITITEFPETIETLKARTQESFLTYSSEEFRMSLKAIICHLRHQHTNYHALLQQLERKPAAIIAYLIIKGRANRLLKDRLASRYGLTESDLADL